MASRAIVTSSAAVAAPQLNLGSFGCTFAITTLVDPVGSMRASMGNSDCLCMFNLQKIGGHLPPLRPPRPCHLPQPCIGIPWRHRWVQEKATLA